MDILAQMQSTFSTQRLELNLISDDDREFVFELVNTEGWLQFIGDRKVRSLDDAGNYIQKIKGTPDLFYWVVRLKDDQTPIGIVSFLKRSYLEHFDLGFAFLPQFNGHGYAYEASNEVLSVARQAYSIILATTVPANGRSIGLLNRLGFSLEKQMEVNGETLQIYRAG
jgi:[ribosomal protein S5]-alanine N-acetyltransferase